jgi:hypothetical protein
MKQHISEESFTRSINWSPFVRRAGYLSWGHKWA